MHIGAAAGCNAGALLVTYLTRGHTLGLSGEELEAAVEVAKVVKKGAAMFMDREVERALKGTAMPAQVGALRSFPRRTQRPFLSADREKSHRRSRRGVRATRSDSGILTARPPRCATNRY